MGRMRNPTFSDSRLSELYSTLRTAPVEESTRRRLRGKVMASLPTARPMLQPAGGFFGHRLWWATAAAAAAAALVFVPTMRERAVGGGGEPGVQIVDIRANGGVHLTWADTGKREYRVLKSDSPTDFSQAKEHRVRGTHYVDNDPDSGQVVYYRVE